MIVQVSSSRKTETPTIYFDARLTQSKNNCMILKYNYLIFKECKFFVNAASKQIKRLDR